MEYSRNVMDIRKFQDLDNCRLKCKERIPQSLRIQVFNAYWSLGTYDKMIEYLTKCIEVCPKLTSKLSAKKKRSCSFRYYIHGFDQIIHLACKGCFLKIFGESHRNLQKICEKLRGNLPQHNTKSPGDDNVNNLEVKVKEEDDDDVLYVAAVDPAVQPSSKMTQVKRENMKSLEDEDVNYLKVNVKKEEDDDVSFEAAIDPAVQLSNKMTQVKRENMKSPEDEDVNHLEVKVKEEDDDDDVTFVAAVDPPAQPTTSQGNNNDVMYCVKQLESLPIVYTTRLDDMNIRRFHTLEPSLFFKKIIHKSRPTLTNDSFKNQTRYIARSKSFRQLRQTINNVNIRIRRELGGKKRKRNREHQGPFELVGGNFKDTHNLCVKPISESPVKNRTEPNIISVEENAKFDLYSYNYRSNYFVIRNTKTTEADVYYFNENGAVTQHFISTKQGNLYTPTIKNAEVPYCCWYQREEFVSLMGKFLPPPTLKYLRKPHPCAMSQCTCCCKQKVDSQDKTKKFSDNSHTSEHLTARGIRKLTVERMISPKKINVLIDDMLNSTPTGTPPTLISKAFAYRPQIAQALGLGSTGLGIDLNQNSNLDHKTVNIFMDYKNGGNEYYQIGSDGEVREHLKNVSASFIQEGAVSYENYEYETICCWQKREYFLNKLKCMNMLPKSKYLKRPHNCPTDKCICCCKPWKKAKIMNNLKEINLPDIPNYSNDPDNKIPPLKFVFANIEPVIPEHRIAELDKLLPSSSNVQTIIDLSTEEEKDLALLESTYKLICENAKYLLESKLNKFKKTYISVNDKKKVTATLDYPVTKLTTNELKILNDILTQAQRSVDALKKPSANFKSNIILNNTAISNHSEAGVECNNLRIAISQSKIPSVKQIKSKMYALMSEWSEVQDDTYAKAVELFFRMQTLHRASMMMSKMHIKDFGQIDSLTELPKKQNARKLKGNNKAKMLDIAVPDVEADSFDFSNNESKDPLAFSNDNSLNNTIQLIRQTDLTASYFKNPLLNRETEDITTAIPVTIITKNAIKLPIHLGRVSLQVPSNPTPMVLNSTDVDLEDEIPVTSIVGFDVEKEPQMLTENNDCILGP